MLNSADQFELLRTIARREPVLFLEEEKNLERIKQERLGVQRGGYVYTPIYPHPLEISLEKHSCDVAMRRLRLAHINKRIEAAVVSNLPWCIEELYMQGAPCNHPNELGYTPLHIAVSRNHFLCVKVLLNMAMDIDVNAKTHKGFTPLYLAIVCKSDMSRKLLEEAGAEDDDTETDTGFRSVVDIDITRPQMVPKVNRAADDRAENLERSPYFG
eukprot:CAMPEP_0118965528 /NCGR_PEP_ID=MMETSP1173-20130426/3080_1 /TAXON_ID=1034831 /ORGANISM="Rhizochromulina marina cf, Strain CCMP1243" /LENGTH=213 /DNA_ID=CAMNT_0006914171 /DNA_START=38 /DNA_END=676 /DNA_ORIENTATION=+